MNVAEYIFLAFPAILVILNPFMAATSFLSMTEGQNEAAQKNTAKRACLTAFLVLMIFAFAGHLIFQVFQITIEAFRIAGGLILFGVGSKMLKFEALRIKVTDEESAEGAKREDVAIVPLGMPILSGPGAITTVMVLTAEIDWHSKWTGSLQMLGLIFSCALSVILIYFILINSSKMLNLFKVIGMGVVTRLMGLILAVIATQFVINGLKGLLPQLKALLS